MRLSCWSFFAVCLVLASPSFAGQSEPLIEPHAVESSLSAATLDDLPIADNVYAVLETTQAEVISDRFNSGGLNVGGDARLGGFLASWSQTLFRVGDLNVSDPIGGGASLLFPSALPWERVDVTTGLMPADVNTAGLAVTLQPRRPATAWRRSVAGFGSGGGLVAGAPSDHPVPITRLQDWRNVSMLASGPLSDRAGIVTALGWIGGSSLTREQRADSRSGLVSGFSHVVFTPSATREIRVLAWVQRAERPLAEWQAYRDQAATTRDTVVHLQSSFEGRLSGPGGWRMFGGVTQRTRVNDTQSTVVEVDRIVAGPVPDVAAAASDTISRRIAFGTRLTPQVAAAADRHRIEIGVDAEHSSAHVSDPFSGLVRELLNGQPVRNWTYIAPASSSVWRATTVAGFVADVIEISPKSTLDASIRFELVRGSAAGAATAISWPTVLPRAHWRWEVSERRHLALVTGYSRSANALNLKWLAFGDPSSPVATVATVTAPDVIVARMGPGTGGTSAFSQIDSKLARPHTDEVVFGIEKRRSPAIRYTLTGIARRESNLMGVVNTGVSVASYSAISLDDAGKDLTDPADDRQLIVYNRQPASFGQDAYLLTNPGQPAAMAYALRMEWQYNGPRLFLLFGATASAAQGHVSNRGYGPLENDQDQPGETFTNPNAESYARGRLFGDRAFTVKWTTLYRMPHRLTVAAVARYQDGQPFSRLVIAAPLNQGPEAVQAHPNAGARFTFTGTLDLRVQKAFVAGPVQVSALFDAYNLLTRNNEVEEYVVSDSHFRSPTAIEPPPSFHLGLRVTF
jgi:hypothetical protein